mmetsp:Transcript_6856/g.19968  ORF Transcript_6856/g.19968 Transcript_6856/m.19968 type:complete len:108 (-) Transcript_6856:213-536(-)
MVMDTAAYPTAFQCLINAGCGPGATLSGTSFLETHPSATLTLTLTLTLAKPKGQHEIYTDLQEECEAQNCDPTAIRCAPLYSAAVAPKPGALALLLTLLGAAAAWWA